jgi:hypothetical protein
MSDTTDGQVKSDFLGKYLINGENFIQSMMRPSRLSPENFVQCRIAACTNVLNHAIMKDQ